MSPFCEPVTAQSTPHSSIRKSMLPIELTPSTMSRAGCLVSFSAFRMAADVAGDAGGGLVVREEHGLDLVRLVGGERLLIPLDRRPLAPLGVEHVDPEAQPLGHVDPEMAEHAEARREDAVAGTSVLESDASHAPVPLAGKMYV